MILGIAGLMIAALILAAAGVMAYDRYGPIGAQISVEFDAAPGTFEDRDFVPGGTDTETVVHLGLSLPIPPRVRDLLYRHRGSAHRQRTESA